MAIIWRMKKGELYGKKKLGRSQNESAIGVALPCSYE